MLALLSLPAHGWTPASAHGWSPAPASASGRPRSSLPRMLEAGDNVLICGDGPVMILAAKRTMCNSRDCPPLP